MERRRTYYIKKEFQRDFIIKFCCLVALGACISAVIIYLMSKSTVTTSFVDSRLRIRSTAEFIMPAVLLSGAVSICLIGAAAALVTLFTSHKIAGPLYRMEKDLESVLKGNLRVRFNTRENDQIKPLLVTLNRVAEKLRTDIGEAKDIAAKLESVSGREDAGKLITGLKETLNRYDT